MPLFFIVIFAVFIVCLLVAVRFLKRPKEGAEPSGMVFSVFAFAASLICFIISFGLMVNLGIYADEFGSSPVLVAGGWFWLNMEWLRLGLLFVLSFASGLSLIRKIKYRK